MGEVYLAEDPRLGRKVALKFLPSQSTADDKLLRRFVQEAKAASALNHPNIVTIYDIGEEARGRFIAMEFIDGQTLRAMGRHPIGLESLSRVGRQVGKALRAAHAAGIIHRDIKPENIMVRDDGYVKVLDFGLARLTDQTDRESTAETALRTDPGVILGTVAYMSPEQARGESLDAASDIFSFGIILYELATRTHPFRADSQVGYLQSIVSQHPISPMLLNPEIPAAMEGLILRMLEKDSRLRPDAAEVERVLGELERTDSEPEMPTMALPSTASARPAAVPVERRTVGHDKHREDLRARFDSVVAGRGLLLCVSGEPGIGKTTLVEDFLGELSAGGQPCSIARGRCSERLAGAEAYLPFLEALDGLLHSPGSQPLARLMKLVAPTWYVQVSPQVADSSAAGLMDEIKTASQERMKRELMALLKEISRQRPLVLFFDDLHWADASTVDLLAYLAAQFDSLPIMIVATYRAAEMLLARHPFRSLKLDLQARGVCHELALEFLTTEDIERYLSLEFPSHRLPAEFPGLIHAKTEGNPLFMADLLRYLRDRKVITDDGGGWALAELVQDIEGELPESVRSMVQRKIEQLGEDDRKLLVGASVQGYEFDSAVVGKALGIDSAHVEDQLEALERVHSFVRMVDEHEFPDRTITLRYRFVHVLYQNALYGSLRPTRRAAMSAAVADALVGYWGARSGEVASDLAFLYEAARDFAQASDYFLAAAQNAAKVFANQEAAKLSRRAVDDLMSLPESPDRDQKELLAQMTLGVALMSVKGFAAPEVEETYGRARALCQKFGESPSLFIVLYGLWSLYVIRAEYETARDIAEQLMRLTEGTEDQALRLQADYTLAVTFDFLGEFADAQKHFEAVESLYDPLQHHSLAVMYGLDPGVVSLSRRARLLWLFGYPEKALEMIDKALDEARGMSHPLSLSVVLQIASTLHQDLNEPAKTLELSESNVALSSEHGLALSLAWAGFMCGWAVGRMGEKEEGLRQMRESWAMMQAIGGKMSHTGFLYLLAYECESAADGLSLLEDALASAWKTGERIYEAELNRLKGELLLKANPNAQSEAEACFQQAIEIARRQGVKSYELRAAMSLARLRKEQGKLEQARETLAGVFYWFTEGFDTADLKDATALLAELS